MQKVFVMYRLKKGVNIEDYKKWSRAVDQRVTPTQKGVHSFQVYEIKGSQKGSPSCQIVEDIDVENWEVWQKVLEGKGMEKVLKEWGEYGDESTLVTIWGEKI